MTHSELIEKVAAGLRRMAKPPDYFLLVGAPVDDDPYGIAWTVDGVCGIPTVNSAFINNTMTDVDIPFIPVWNDIGIWDAMSECTQFNKGFEEGV